MKFNPKTMGYRYQFKTIDSHTMGESTRIIYDGFPELPGKTMMEKKQYLEKHYDKCREAIMLEPRGHRDMFGALLTEPVHEEADIGVIFMDSGNYLNMCGHGSIGVASMAVETGMVKVTEPYTEVVLDAPSGIIRTRVHVVNHKAVDVSILNVPSFLYKTNQIIETDKYGTIMYDISFGGSFFALVDADVIGLKLTIDNMKKITDLGMELRKKINETQDIQHPYLDINTVDLVEFYTRECSEKATMKNCVIFGGAQADRSPCGTGTSAKIAALYAAFNKKQTYPKELSMFIVFAVTSVISVVCTIMNGSIGQIANLNAGMWIGIFYSGIFINAVGYTSWMLALEYGNTAVISNLAYIVPFLSMIFSRIVLKEEISIYSIVGVVMIVGGILLQIREA